MLPCYATARWRMRRYMARATSMALSYAIRQRSAAPRCCC